MQMAVCKFRNHAYITSTSTPHISALFTFRPRSCDQSSHNSRQLLVSEVADNANKHKRVLGVDVIFQAHPPTSAHTLHRTAQPDHYIVDLWVGLNF
jgi:hypothetical protein